MRSSSNNAHSSANHCLNHATALFFPLAIASLSPFIFSSLFVKHPCATPGKCTYSTGNASSPFLSKTWKSLASHILHIDNIEQLTNVRNENFFNSSVNMASTCGANNKSGTLPYPVKSSSVTQAGCAQTTQSTSGGSCSFAPRRYALVRKHSIAVYMYNTYQCTPSSKTISHTPQLLVLPSQFPRTSEYLGLPNFPCIPLRKPGHVDVLPPSLFDCVCIQDFSPEEIRHIHRSIGFGGEGVCEQACVAELSTKCVVNIQDGSRSGLAGYVGGKGGKGGGSARGGAGPVEGFETAGGESLGGHFDGAGR
jgi:hypothetical protein